MEWRSATSPLRANSSSPHPNKEAVGFCLLIDRSGTRRLHEGCRWDGGTGPWKTLPASQKRRWHVKSAKCQWAARCRVRWQFPQQGFSRHQGPAADSGTARRPLAAYLTGGYPGETTPANGWWCVRRSANHSLAGSLCLCPRLRPGRVPVLDPGSLPPLLGLAWPSAVRFASVSTHGWIVCLLWWRS